MALSSRRPLIIAVVAWMVIPAAMLTTMLSGAPVAAADTKVVMVTTGSGSLNVRVAPSTNAPLLGTIRNGTKMVITCFVHGDVFVGGPYGGASDIWNRREGGGFATDRLLDTGSNTPVVPPCTGADATYRPTGSAPSPS